MANEPADLEGDDLEDDPDEPEAPPSAAEAAMTILTNKNTLATIKAVSDDWIGAFKGAAESNKKASLLRAAVVAPVLVATVVATYFLADAGKLKSPETVYMVVIGGAFLYLREK